MKLIKRFFTWLFSRRSSKYTYDHEDNRLNWSSVERDIVDEVNKMYRGGILSKKLIPDRRLREAAQLRTKTFKDDMVCNHDGFFDMENRVLIPLGLKTAEVIGNGYDYASSLVYAWSRSPKHHKVLSKSSYRYIGVSRVYIKLMNKDTRVESWQWVVCCLLAKKLK